MKRTGVAMNKTGQYPEIDPAERAAADVDEADLAEAAERACGPGIPETTSAGDVHVGFFSFREKLGRQLWHMVQETIFRFSFRRADRWRAFLLRRFGATIGRNCLIRSNIKVEVPWNLTIGDNCMIGEAAILYSLGPITIGDNTIISQYAHICAGTHDYTRSDMILHRVPVRIGSDVWVCTDVYVGPGVVVGDGALVGARSTVVRDLPAWQICVGNPAKPVRKRPFTRVDASS
jgi:putative colanic acid biosynthesis acetyltransferase WcaF